MEVFCVFVKFYVFVEVLYIYGSFRGIYKVLWSFNVYLWSFCVSL